MTDEPASTRLNVFEAYGLALAAACLVSGPLALLGPEASAVRNPQTALTVLFGVAFALQVHRHGWPEAVTVRPWVRWTLFGSVLAWFSLAQVLKLHAFHTSGTDFTTYERMLFNTWHGALGYTPVYDVNHFGVHLNYVLFPLVPLHRVLETPLFLVFLNGLGLWGAALPLWALAKKRWHEGGALLLVAAYWTCPWVARSVDGGFKPEALYPLAALTFLLAWESGRARAWVPAAVFYLSLKEDAALHLAAFAVAVAWVERARWRPAAALGAASLALLGLGSAVVQPHMLAGYAMQPVYGLYWPQYGTTLREVALGMLSSPLTLAGDVLTSGWYKVLGPALLLPFAAPRAWLPMLPTLVMLGSTRYPMMRNYEWYYALPLLGWLFSGLLEARRSRYSEAAVLAAALLFPLVGGGYLRLPVPDAAQQRGYTAAVAALEARPGRVCVQLQTFPRLPTTVDARPLTPACAAEPGVRLLLNLDLNPYPWTRTDLERLLTGAQGRTQATGGGFVVVDGPIDWR